MLLTVFNISVALLMVAFIGIYLSRYRNQDPGVFNPAAAWLRASIFFCACFQVCWWTGTQAMILESPIVTEAQLRDSTWIAWTLGLTLLIVAAYWGIWGRYTLRFDRKLHLATQIPFGLVWGASTGQLILVVWREIAMVGANWPAWQIVLVSWTILVIWQWLWQDMYWDLYVTPEHDTQWSLSAKTIGTHIPQITLCLIYLTLFNNYVILIGLQMLALVGASVCMRLAPWWSKEATPPARRQPFVFGTARAGGYESKDPANDPYLKAAHLPTGADRN